jgi:hypothetical protein
VQNTTLKATATLTAKKEIKKKKGEMPWGTHKHLISAQKRDNTVFKKGEKEKGRGSGTGKKNQKKKKKKKKKTQLNSSQILFPE